MLSTLLILNEKSCTKGPFFSSMKNSRNSEIQSPNTATSNGCHLLLTIPTRR